MYNSVLGFIILLEAKLILACNNEHLPNVLTSIAQVQSCLQFDLFNFLSLSSITCTTWLVWFSITCCNTQKLIWQWAGFSRLLQYQTKPCCSVSRLGHNCWFCSKASIHFSLKWTALTFPALFWKKKCEKNIINNTFASSKINWKF